MKKRLTREERKRRSNRRLMMITYLLFLILMLGYLTMTAEAEPQEEPAEPTVQTIDGILPGDDTPATTRCYMTEEEVEQAENEMIEAALLARATRIDNVTVTHYDCCVECCGKDDGITASGVRATPGVTVAVDPSVIPLGADVLVDYGDGDIKYYRADDVGGAVKGNHIDLCVSSHQEAVELGRKTAAVWWVMPE